VDEPEFTLWCATAPYVLHVDDELVGLNASSGALVHKKERSCAQDRFS
jgi:hypothetical protein